MAAKQEGGGRTALVTGGNRGLGLETCRQLHRDGYRVILTARDPAGGEAAAKPIGAEFRPLDVTDAASIAALAASLTSDGVIVDVLVNNAAVALDGFNAEVARKTIDANVYGPLRVTDALLSLIPDGGTVVMVSSGVGELSGMPQGLRAQFASPNLDSRRASRPGRVLRRRRRARPLPGGWLAGLGVSRLEGRAQRADPHPRASARAAKDQGQRRLPRLGADADGWLVRHARCHRRREVDRLGSDTAGRRPDRRVLQGWAEDRVVVGKAFAG